MIATLYNIKREYAKHGDSLVIVDSEGDTYSANPSDYFWASPDYTFTDGHREPCNLAIRVGEDIEPITDRESYCYYCDERALEPGHCDRHKKLISKARA